jgi:hypothetical protein
MEEIGCQGAILIHGRRAIVAFGLSQRDEQQVSIVIFDVPDTFANGRGSHHAKGRERLIATI